MARPRLITFTSTGRLLGCSSTAEAARAVILENFVAAHPQLQRFYEQSSDQEPRQIQVRAAWRGEVVELGYIIVERGLVDDVLGQLKDMEAAGV
jgi:hypothetical protein